MLKGSLLVFAFLTIALGFLALQGLVWVGVD